MPNKLPGAHMAVGYWGGNLNKRIRSEQIPEKVRVLLQDKLLGMGRPAFLYLPVTDMTAEVLGLTLTGSLVDCTCDKETAKASEDRCFSCYGSGKIPGYTLFLHNTLFASSAQAVQPGPYTLTDCSVDFNIKPNRVLMDSGVTTCTIETDDQAFSNVESEDWETRINAFERSTGSTVTAEFSTDAGGSFFSFADINGTNKPTGTGTIRFRITMTRLTSGDKAPAFEILRIRRVLIENQNKAIVQARPDDYSAGQILIARTWVIERTIRDAGRGRNTDHSSDKAWTSPLDFFDITLTADTPSVVVRDREAGPHPFYEKSYGVDTGARYPLYQESWSEELLTFTHQAFFDRRAQAGENYFLVF